MPNSLPDKKNYVLISDAASLLGVSIDTVRRWDSEGKVHSVRLNGKNRYFSIDELTYFNNTRPLTVAEVAQRLNLSVVSIRRFENEGLITAHRNSRGERVFQPTEIDRFIKERELKKITKKENLMLIEANVGLVGKHAIDLHNIVNKFKVLLINSLLKLNLIKIFLEDVQWIV